MMGRSNEAGVGGGKSERHRMGSMGQRICDTQQFNCHSRQKLWICSFFVTSYAQRTSSFLFLTSSSPLAPQSISQILNLASGVLSSTERSCVFVMIHVLAYMFTLYWLWHQLPRTGIKTGIISGKNSPINTRPRQSSGRSSRIKPKSLKNWRVPWF